MELLNCTDGGKSAAWALNGLTEENGDFFTEIVRELRLDKIVKNLFLSFFGKINCLY